MISVIIPAYNAEKLIRRCLDSLTHQSVDSDRYEVIVVDDGSTDATTEIVASHPAVRLLRQANAGPAAARNHGVREARGEIILLTDSDCRLTPTWIEAMTAPFQSDADVVGVKGRYLTVQAAPAARFVQLEYEHKYDKLKRHETIDFIDTYSAGFKREVFLEMGGYDEDFPVACAEDVELSYRMSKRGYRMVYKPEAIVYHMHPETFRDYLKKKFKFARWRMLAVRKNPSKAIRDSHTPQLMKVQVLLGPLSVAAAVVLLVIGPWWAALAAGGVFFLTTIPFAVKALRKDVPIGLISPLILLARSFAQFLGILRSLADRPSRRVRASPGDGPLA